MRQIVQCDDRSSLVRRLFLFCIPLFAIIMQTTLLYAGQNDFEESSVLDVATILQPKNLHDPLYTVDSQVLNNGFVNTYQVKSRFGNFTVTSTPP